MVPLGSSALHGLLGVHTVCVPDGADRSLARTRADRSREADRLYGAQTVHGLRGARTVCAAAAAAERGRG
jgi:hypothetical protein